MEINTNAVHILNNTGHGEQLPSSVPVEEGWCDFCKLNVSVFTPHFKECKFYPSHHEASPKVEEWTDNYIITRLIELNPNKTWKEIEPVYKFVSALLLQKEEESTLTERKRVNDILDGMKEYCHEENHQRGCLSCVRMGKQNEALKEAKHLINNTQEK